MVGGLILLEAGLSRKSLQLRLQGYAAFAASFLRIWFVNLNASGSPGEISPRFYTLVPLTLAFFYAYWRLHEAGDHLRELERKYRAADFCCWLGTITLAALMRFELPADWRSEEHTSELQSLTNLVCRLLLAKKTISRT